MQIWHKLEHISKYEPHKMFQMAKNLVHYYSTISNMRRYRQQLQKFILLFYLLFLSPHHISLSLSLSLSLSSNLCLLSHLCLLYSSSTTRRSPKATTRCRRSSVFSFPLQVLFFFPFFLFPFTFFGCGLMGGLGDGFGVLLWGFWCETVVGRMWVGCWWLLAAGVGCELW